MWVFKWLCYCPSLPLAMHRCLHSWKASASNIQKPTNTCVTISLSLCSDLNKESFWIVSQQGKTGLQAFPWYWQLWLLEAKLWSRRFSWDRCFIFVCVYVCNTVNQIEQNLRSRPYESYQGTGSSSYWQVSHRGGTGAALATSQCCRNSVQRLLQVSKVFAIVCHFGTKQKGKFSFKLEKKKNSYCLEYRGFFEWD